MSDFRHSASIATTAEGFKFDSAANVWKLGAALASVTFDFSLPAASSALQTHIKGATLAWVSAKPTIACHQDFKEIRVFLRRRAATHPISAIGEITAAHLHEYVEGLPHGAKHRANKLVYALVHWAETGVGGLADCLLSELPHVHFETPASGQAVMTFSPTKGALTREQRDGLCAKLREVWTDNRGARANACAAMLTARLGKRPFQLCCLKTCDLVEAAEPGTFAADLLVSVAKQGPGCRPRGEFARVGLMPELEEMVAGQCDDARAWATRHGVNPRSAPMFPTKIPVGASLPRRAPGMAGHMTPNSLSRRISRLVRHINGVPDRAEGELVTPVRLRRTLASILADEGWALEDIATLLDQNSAGTALIYVQATAALADRLDSALGDDFADLAAGFDGDPSTILASWEEPEDEAS